jgi:hypothetical protein
MRTDLRDPAELVGGGTVVDALLDLRLALSHAPLLS